MMPCGRKFSCLTIPRSAIREQSNPAGMRGSMDALYCCAWAENLPRPNSARKTPARAIHSPIMTHRLKNPLSLRLRRAGAECEVDFFFMDGASAEVWFFVHSSFLRPLLDMSKRLTPIPHLPPARLAQEWRRTPKIFRKSPEPWLYDLANFLPADYVRCSWLYSAASI